MICTLALRVSGTLWLCVRRATALRHYGSWSDPVCLAGMVVGCGHCVMQAKP